MNRINIPIKKALPVVLFCMALLIGNLAFAQPGQTPREKIKALKVAFISNRLQLTSQEAEGFWPVYNEMQDKMGSINQQLRQLLKQARDGYYTMSDADMEKLLEKGFDLKQQQLDVEKLYYQKFKKVLPIKKIALLNKVERDFKMEVLKQAMGKED